MITQPSLQKPASAPLMVEIGAGELIDKITILRIKSDRMTDPTQRRHVNHELRVLNAARDRHLVESPELGRLETALMAVNSQLWQIEDDIRTCERDADFGPAFIALARAVYKTNDRRAALKKQINLLTGATIVEEKSYPEAG